MYTNNEEGIKNTYTDIYNNGYIPVCTISSKTQLFQNVVRDLPLDRQGFVSHLVMTAKYFKQFNA